MFEVRVAVSNMDFMGTTDVYDTYTSIADFANQLVDFPNKKNMLFYELGERDSYSYFSMRFYLIDNFGKTGVEVNIEKNVSTDREEEKDKLKLEIIVEICAIDNFQKELTLMAKNKDGTATLYGKDCMPNN